MARLLCWCNLLPLCLLTVITANAADFSQYRDYKLGASTADILSATKSTPRELTTLHARPSLLQELSWRPAHTMTKSGSDSIGGVVFSFLDNRLYRIAVEYARSRTEGLSRGDMTASLVAVYGPVGPLPAQPRRRPGYDSLDVPTTVALWLQGDTTIALQTSEYSATYGLVITSTSREALARKAQAASVTMDEREAPVREAARAKDAAAAAKAADDKTRSTNKATFTP